VKNEDLLRDEINQLIRAEIQQGINDYVDEKEVVEKAGLGFVGKEEEKELKVKVPVSEVDKIIKEYKKIKKRERKSNLSTVKLLDQHGRQM
tara:strand:+ start:198 stop:470 length:273 start_codon:yes stop_codon:yes gene_type:complete